MQTRLLALPICCPTSDGPLPQALQHSENVVAVGCGWCKDGARVNEHGPALAKGRLDSGSD